MDVPVLVVGAGPTGLTAARLLSNAGLDCLLVERRPSHQTSPSAHVVNARTLEILRQAGFDMDAIAAISKNPADAGHVNFLTTLSGELIGRLPFERQGDEVLAYTPTPLRNISQHRLEPVLAGEVARSPGVDLRYGTEWVSSDPDATGVSSIVRDVATGANVEVRSRYVLACDGAGSGIRKSLGIEMNGIASIRDRVAIHLRINLRPLVAHRLGVLHFIMAPEINGTFIAHDLDSESVLMIGRNAETTPVEYYTQERCAEIVRVALGDVDVPFEVVSANPWRMTAQVAERMRDGRVFLVGDAAHRFPPTGGLGLNSGVADAHNLVWKLDAVEKGWATPSLLDTYESERLPVVHANCDQSTTNAMKMGLLIKALGIGPGTTRVDLERTLADPANRPAIDDAVAEQATHFDMLGLQLGYVYIDGALAWENRLPQAMTDPSRFEPDAAVGSRLPHGWLTDGRSTLDLVASDAMTLISVGAHEEWADAVQYASRFSNRAIPVAHVRLEHSGAVDAWRQRCGLGETGALLVRPDQHVFWKGTGHESSVLVRLCAGMDRVYAPVVEQRGGPAGE